MAVTTLFRSSEGSKPYIGSSFNPAAGRSAESSADRRRAHGRPVGWPDVGSAASFLPGSSLRGHPPAPPPPPRKGVSGGPELQGGGGGGGGGFRRRPFSTTWFIVFFNPAAGR